MTTTKAWYVTVLKNNYTRIEYITCFTPAQATAKLNEMKEKYINQPATENSPAVKYDFFREQY